MSMKTRTVLPATLDAVDRLCGELRGGLFASLPCAERFPVELLLREALTNAVVHGLKGGPQGEVHCEMVIFSAGVTIHVCDAGEGFDWCRALSPRLRWGRCRSPAVASKLCAATPGHLQFNSNGNCVRATRAFKEGKEEVWLNLKAKRQGDAVVVAPGGDVLSSSCRKCELPCATWCAPASVEMGLRSGSNVHGSIDGCGPSAGGLQLNYCRRR